MFVMACLRESGLLSCFSFRWLGSRKSVHLFCPQSSLLFWFDRHLPLLLFLNSFFKLLSFTSHGDLLLLVHGLYHVLLIIIVSNVIELIRVVVGVVSVVDHSLRILADKITFGKSLIIKRINSPWLRIGKKRVMLSQWIGVSWVWFGDGLSVVNGGNDYSSLFAHNFSITTITVWQYESIL